MKTTAETAQGERESVVCEYCKNHGPGRLIIRLPALEMEVWERLTSTQNFANLYSEKIARFALVGTVLLLVTSAYFLPESTRGQKTAMVLMAPFCLAIYLWVIAHHEARIKQKKWERVLRYAGFGVEKARDYPERSFVVLPEE